MKQAQNARKGRARGGIRKQGKNAEVNRTDAKVRGNPKQLVEKYKNQAREATQSGDRVAAENHFQYADHYQRVVNEMRGLTKGLFTGDYVLVPPSEIPQEAPQQEEGGQHHRHRNSRGERMDRGDRNDRGDRRPHHRMNDESTRSSARIDTPQNTDKISENMPQLNSSQVSSSQVSSSQVNPGPLNTDTVVSSKQPPEVHPELDLQKPSANGATNKKEEDISAERPRRARRTVRPRTEQKTASGAEGSSTEKAPIKKTQIRRPIRKSVKTATNEVAVGKDQMSGTGEQSGESENKKAKPLADDPASGPKDETGEAA